MKMLAWAGLGLSAVLTCLAPAPAAAQSAATGVYAPSGYAPMQSPCVKQADGTCVPVSGTAPLPTAPGPLAAPTPSAAGGVTELAGTATSTTCTATSGSCSVSAGTVTIGALSPQLGRDIRVVLKGTWAGSIQIGTSTAANACAPGTINPLTVGGAAWGSFTANANEPVDTPTLVGIVYCATATISSGTLTYSVRQ